MRRAREPHSGACASCSAAPQLWSAASSTPMLLAVYDTAAATHNSVYCCCAAAAAPLQPHQVCRHRAACCGGLPVNSRCAELQRLCAANNGLLLPEVLHCATALHSKDGAAAPRRIRCRSCRAAPAPPDKSALLRTSALQFPGRLLKDRPPRLLLLLLLQQALAMLSWPHGRLASAGAYCTAASAAASCRAHVAGQAAAGALLPDMRQRVTSKSAAAARMQAERADAGRWSAPVGAAGAGAAGASVTTAGAAMMSMSFKFSFKPASNKPAAATAAVSSGHPGCRRKSGSHDAGRLLASAPPAARPAVLVAPRRPPDTVLRLLRGAKAAPERAAATLSQHAAASSACEGGRLAPSAAELEVLLPAGPWTLARLTSQGGCGKWVVLFFLLGAGPERLSSPCFLGEVQPGAVGSSVEALQSTHSGETFCA